MTGRVFGLITLVLFIFASVAAADIVTGLDAGGASQVKNFDNNGFETASFFAYAGFTGGVRVGAGDVNGDGVADIITGTGPGAAGGNVKVFDGLTGALIRSFLAFDPSFTGGVFVAGGDVNGDGLADIIVGTDTGSSQVKVFDGATNAVIASFFAYPGFTGGVRVGAGDINGDGAADIITGTGPGAAGGNVKVFDGLTGALLRNFLAFDPSFTGGVFVAGGDVNRDGLADIIVGTDTGSSQVKVFDGATGAVIASFLAYPSFTGGVRVGAGDINGDGAADIISAPGPGSSGVPVKVFDGLTNMEIRNFAAYPGLTNGAYVAGRATLTPTPTPTPDADCDADTYIDAKAWTNTEAAPNSGTATLVINAQRPRLNSEPEFDVGCSALSVGCLRNPQHHTYHSSFARTGICNSLSETTKGVTNHGYLCRADSVCRSRYSQH